MEEPDRRAPDPDDPAYAGQAAYTPAMLRIYDVMVVRLANSIAWRCPARRILDHYQQHAAPSHLEVGPGTAYYPDRCRWPVASPRLTLLDPNPDVLRFARHRLRRYGPAVHAGDVLTPVALPPVSFDSISLGYVLHCLPGTITAKAVALDHLIPLLRPGGVLFGSTVVNRGVHHTRAGRYLLRRLNRTGVFSNLDDDRGDLERALADRFPRFDVEVHGSVTFFAGHVP
jgi:SAM-dependent methyltransferase